MSAFRKITKALANLAEAEELLLEANTATSEHREYGEPSCEEIIAAYRKAHSAREFVVNMITVRD